RFRVAFIDNPDMTSDNFFDKLQKQLDGENVLVYRYFIELMCIYYSVTDSVTPKTKMKNLNLIASWKGIDLTLLPAEYFKILDKGMIKPGGVYNQNIYNELTLLHIFTEKLKEEDVEERKNILADPKQLKALTEFAREETGRAQIQHMIQYYLLPDYFERIGSLGH